MLTYWLWLAHRPGLKDRMKLTLLQQFQDPEMVYFADDRAYDHVEGMTSEVRQALQDKDLSQAKKILEDCRKERLQILTFQDAAYPARLKNIYDPPLVLYYKGQLPELDANPVIGVVGTRNASVYGIQTAKRMGWQIGKCGGIVVSGMAKGIDSAATSGALSAGVPAVGVLGCGADIVYPASNRFLFRDMEKMGCLISEFPPGTPPVKWNFPKRNRIISGLSCGVLVVEAPEKSGALITAAQALDQGRDVFTVPGNIDIPTFTGSNRLLREGAMAVASGWDILSEYQALFPDKIRKWDGPSIQQAYPDEVAKQEPAEPLKVAQTPALPEEKKELKKEFRKNPIDKAASTSYSDVNTTFAGLSGQALELVQCLKNGERTVDDLIAETGMTTGTLLGLLTVLELKGVVKRLPGKRISLK